MDNQKVNLEHYKNFYVNSKAIHEETGVNTYRSSSSLTTITSVKLLTELLISKSMLNIHSRFLMSNNLIDRKHLL